MVSDQDRRAYFDYLKELGEWRQIYGLGAMKRMRTAYGVGSAICIVIAGAILIYAAQILGHALKEAITAVFAGLFSIFSAVLGFIFTRLKEVEASGNQRMRELEKLEQQSLRELEKLERQKYLELQAAERTKKQQNYERVIETLAPYIRKEPTADDKFATAYVHTWVVGSSAVLIAVQKFLNTPSYQTLDAVLMAMREDMELGDPASHFSTDPVEFTSRGLFAPEVKKVRDTILQDGAKND